MNMYKEITELMNRVVNEWAICGGDAIDLFVGRQTRLHKDIDITVFWEDRETLIEYLLTNGWRIFEPDSGMLREITGLDNDLRTEDNLWCVKKGSDSFQIQLIRDHYYQITTRRQHQDKLDFVELLFNHKEDNCFVYKRDSSIKLQSYILFNNDNIPYLTPEMVLLYKSNYIKFLNREDMKYMVDNYRHDFHVAYPLLNNNQKRWLKEAIQKSYPDGHEWFEEY